VEDLPGPIGGTLTVVIRGTGEPTVGVVTAAAAI
jgi:hypothetical protein